MAANELEGPNSINWEEIQEHQLEELQKKFWEKFVNRYYQLAREGKL